METKYLSKESEVDFNFALLKVSIVPNRRGQGTWICLLHSSEGSMISTDTKQEEGWEQKDILEIRVKGLYDSVMYSFTGMWSLSWESMQQLCNSVFNSAVETFGHGNPYQSVAKYSSMKDFSSITQGGGAYWYLVERAGCSNLASTRISPRAPNVKDGPWIPARGSILPSSNGTRWFRAY